MNTDDLRKEIISLTKKFAQEKYEKEFCEEKEIVSGNHIPYAGRVFGFEEVTEAVSSLLDFWLTFGENGKLFESSFSSYIGSRKSIMVNSGSSANLVAISTLCSTKLPKDKRICKDDEVITCAAGFPTTVFPIIQNNAIPVFIDNDAQNGNVDPSLLELAYRPGKTKAVIFAHTLGNPFDLGQINKFCKKYNLFLIEDNCDSLGSEYTIDLDLARECHMDNLIGKAKSGNYSKIQILNDGSGKKLRFLTGSVGDISTQSFYPPHHITAGEGGMVNFNFDPKLCKIGESIRDWGRDCYCPSGQDNTCNARYLWQLGDLPKGYDHKYIYSNLGYNLKPLDIQASIGLVQLKRLDNFNAIRRRNWNYLYKNLKALNLPVSYMTPTHCELTKSSYTKIGEKLETNPAWFGFMVDCKNLDTRNQMAKYLEERNIGNRMLFGGNLLRQPVFIDFKREYPDRIREVGSFEGADHIMNKTLFLGVYPGLSTNSLDYMIDSIKNFYGK